MIESEKCVCAIVEHFLDDYGRSYFPKWVSHVENLLQNNSDARSFNLVKGIGVKHKSYEPNRCLIEVKFRSLASLSAWVATEQHREILQMLEPFALQERKTIIYEYVESGLSPSIVRANLEEKR